MWGVKSPSHLCVAARLRPHRGAAISEEEMSPGPSKGLISEQQSVVPGHNAFPTLNILPSRPVFTFPKSGLLHPGTVHVSSYSTLSSPLPSSSSSAFDQSRLDRRSSLDLAEIFLHGLLRPSSPPCNGLCRASSPPELRASFVSQCGAGTWAQPHSRPLLRQPSLRRPHLGCGLVATRTTRQ